MIPQPKESKQQNLLLPRQTFSQTSWPHDQECFSHHPLAMSSYQHNKHSLQVDLNTPTEECLQRHYSLIHQYYFHHLFYFLLAPSQHHLSMNKYQCLSYRYLHQYYSNNLLDNKTQDRLTQDPGIQLSIVFAIRRYQLGLAKKKQEQRSGYILP